MRFLFIIQGEGRSHLTQSIAKNKQVCLTRSLAYNVLRVPKFLRSMHYIQQVIL